MSTKFNWSISAKIEDGPSFAAAQSREVQAYGKVTATVPAQDGAPGTVTAEVQPLTDAEHLVFLSVTASSYGDDLTFSVVGGVSDVVLDGALLLSGASIGGLLGGSPEQITFSNAGDAEVDVEILVGRQAVIAP